MPRAVKDSEPFNVEIYKDAALTQLIARMTDGVIIDATNISPGVLKNVEVTPIDSRVV